MSMEPAETPEEQQEQEIVILDLTAEGTPDLPVPRVASQDSGTGDDKKKEARQAPPLPSGAPSAAEWQDFLGCTVLRLLTQAYLHLVLFREIDESDLTPHERDLICLDKEDLKDIAAPMATVAAKNKIARKHGRSILAMAGSYESVIDLLIWGRRVNKIARKYRTPVKAATGTDVKQGVVFDGPVPGPNEQEEVVIINRGTG